MTLIQRGVPVTTAVHVAEFMVFQGILIDQSPRDACASYDSRDYSLAEAYKILAANPGKLGRRALSERAWIRAVLHGNPRALALLVSSAGSFKCDFSEFVQ